MKLLRLFVLLFILSLFYSCSDKPGMDKNSVGMDNNKSNDNCFVINDQIKIAILSDIHVMDPSLLVKDGSAFQDYLAKDPKLLQFSTRILQVTVNQIIAQKPNLVLIASDLTKDGERISHETVSGILKQFNQHKIKVLVTPGNHDINNPEAVRFVKDQAYPVPSIPAFRFPAIYGDFGFNTAISRDPNSLSYVNEPVKGLWVITIDANKYYENTTLATIGGVIKSETMQWVKNQLWLAKWKGKTVLGMMHHGLILHYAAQNDVDPGYVVDNSDAAANELMDAGLKIIFTGHYHANDITKREHNGKFIYDVETGSTVAYPCTYRMMTINGNKYSFRPQNTTHLMWWGFDEYAKSFLSKHLDGYFYYALTNAFGVPSEYAIDFAPYYRAGAMAHFAGDEVMPGDIMDQFAYLNLVDPSGGLSLILGSLWTDINTTDNCLTINMDNGVAL